MKKFKKMIVGMVVLCVCCICLVVFLFEKEKQEMKRITLKDIHMQEIQDGEYIGEYETTLIQVQVKVIMKEHRIQDILLLKHENGRGDDANKIIDTMIQKNNDQVDLISGATYSSLVIQKAVNQALEGGMNS